MKLNDAVATRIKEFLKQRGMTQYALFKKSGVSEPTISCLVNSRDPTCKLITLANLVQGFGIGLKDFFDSDLFTYENIITD